MTGLDRIAAIACVALTACVSAPAATSADPTGCWYFERDQHAAALNLPWGVRLVDEALVDARAHSDARLARTLNPDGETDFPFGFWALEPGDSLVIGYPAGGGLLLTLARGDTSMHGTARALGDAMTLDGAPRPVRPVHLSRAQCPAS